MTNRRNEFGQALACLSLLFSVLVILPMGLFAYEFFRMVSGEQELRSVCDAAALAGAAELASVDPNDADLGGARQNAMNAASNMFLRNFLLGQSLMDAEVHYCEIPQDPRPPAGQTWVYIELIDTHGQPVGPTGDAASIRVLAYSGYTPSFGRLISVNNVTIKAESDGGLMPFDIAICFDISGSIDDQTPVTFVKRYWTGSEVAYDVPAGGSGVLFDILQPPKTGTRANGLAPQNLASASYAGTTDFGGTGNMHPLFFTESPPADFPSNQMAGLRANLAVGSVAAGSEVGCPPGNFDPATPASTYGNGVSPDQDPSAFTDLVVNLDGNNTFGGWTSPDGFDFPNVATLVEAARGNLDLTPAQLAVSQGNKTSALLPAPRPGYRAAYLKRAEELITPLRQAKEAALNFVDTMKLNADGHFAIVSFSDGVGTSYDSTWTAAGTQYGATDRCVDANWPAGGTGVFPMPLLHLNDGGGAGDNYAASRAAIAGLKSTGMTDIANALKASREELTGPAKRTLCRRAILLFTDGLPNIPQDIYVGTPGTHAAQHVYDEAKLCKAAGIPVYCIGLAQNKKILHVECMVLGDSSTQPPPPQGAGVARLTGGIFVPVTDANTLNDAFQLIERSLVTLR